MPLLKEMVLKSLKPLPGMMQEQAIRCVES
jgi:hypothetical protein